MVSLRTSVVTMEDLSDISVVQIWEHLQNDISGDTHVDTDQALCNDAVELYKPNQWLKLP